MQNHLTDLDELLEDVRSGSSQEYISEAIRCYRAGAYRSAIITTWVAVCIDIIEKIRELGSEGDKGAKPLKKQFDDLKEKNIDLFLEYERHLLKYAYDDLAIISNDESKLLQRIKDDRNLCAHPNFLDSGKSVLITAECARYHIVSACKTLLHHPPIRGKILIGKIQKRIAENSFPTDMEKAHSELSTEHYLKRAQDSVFRNLTIIFLKQIFHGNRFSEPKVMRISSALHAISRLKPSIYKKTLAEKLDSLISNMSDKMLKRIFFLPHLWSYIKKTDRDRIIKVISKLSSDDIIKYKLGSFADASQKISKTLIARLNELDYREKLQVITDSSANSFKDIVIDMFINSPSFASSYEYGRGFLLPHAQYFNAANLKAILDGSLQNSRWRINQILNAGGMDEVFTTLFNETKQTIPEYNDIWLEFWNTLDRHANSFSSLSELLLENHIITIPPPVPPVVQPMPIPVPPMPIPVPPMPTPVPPVPSVEPDDDT